MLLLRYYRCVHVLVFLGILAYSVAEENLMYAIVALPVVVAAYMVVGGPGGRPLPRWMINLGLLGATVAMVLSWNEPLGNTISVLCSYLVWLQLIKLFEPRTVRDQAQVIVLSLMLAVGACLTSVTAELGAVLVVYVPFVLVTVLLHQLYAAQARLGGDAGPRPATIAPGSGDAVPGDWKARMTAWIVGAGGASSHAALPATVYAGRRGRADLSRVSFLAFALIAAVAPVVYVGMPRGLGESMFGQMQPTNSTSVTGFRDQVQLGSAGLISESPRIVARMKVSAHGRAIEGLGRAFRLRGAVLDRYDADRGLWQRSRLMEATDRRLVLGSTDHLVPTSPQGPFLLAEITLLSQPVNCLFTLWKPVAVMAKHPSGRLFHEFNLFDGQIEIPIRAGELTYEVACSPADPSPAGPVPFVFSRSNGPPWAVEYAALTGRGEALPEPVGPQFRGGAIEELSRRLLRDSRIDVGDDESQWRRRAVSAFARHLQRTCAYTTVMVSPPAGEDPIEMFLFDEERGRKGHCEYFASALAAMSLSVGIPARVVTGYLACEFDASREVYTIRESHAHAWVEAEVRDGLWEEFDPSPSAVVQRIQQAQTGIASVFRRVIDALQFAWIEGVVTFNQDRQSDTLRAMATGPIEALRALNNRLAAMLATERAIAQENRTVYWARLTGWTVLLATAMFLGVHAAATRGVRLVRRIVGWPGKERAGTESDAKDPITAELGSLYARMLAALSRAGAAKPAHVPGLRHLRDMSESHLPREATEAALRLAECYYRARFAGMPVGRNDVSSAAGWAREVESALREARRARG